MKNSFEKIKLSQLYTLCNIIDKSEIRHSSYIKQKYTEIDYWFDETFLLLEELKIVFNDSNILALSKNISPCLYSVDVFKKKFLSILFSAKGDISEVLRNFLLKFHIDSDEIIFKATEFEKIKFSDTRNILLELEFIIPSVDNKTYFVKPEHSDLFIGYFNSKELSLDMFKKIQLNNESLGLATEKAVIDFEISRLTNIPFEPNDIEHTSQTNVLAGYDVKSFENYLDGHSKRINRYIEVKAVSSVDFKFYWSRVEREISNVLREQYYLYLLPVVSNTSFDFEKLIIINNPFENIYLNDQEWKKTEESLSFSKCNNQ